MANSRAKEQVRPVKCRTNGDVAFRGPTSDPVRSTNLRLDESVGSPRARASAPSPRSADCPGEGPPGQADSNLAIGAAMLKALAGSCDAQGAMGRRQNAVQVF